MRFATTRSLTAMAATVLLALSPILALAPAASAAANAHWAAAVEVVEPPDANPTTQSTDLYAVSCASAGNCAAVGEYNDLLNGKALLVSETDGTWSDGSGAVLPDGAATTNQAATLRSISCRSAGNCSAAGSYYDSSNNQQPLFVDLVDGTWADGIEGVLPSDAATSNLQTTISGISCASAGNCTAVGYYIDSDGYDQGVLLDQVDGTWQTGIELKLPTGAPATGTSASLTSVSCASAGNCTATGDYGDVAATTYYAIGVSEVSGVWKRAVLLGLPSNAATTAPFSSEVEAVSCPSAGNCSAVGEYATTAGDSAGVLLTEKSGSWQVGKQASLPANAATTGSEPDLTALSCSAVGTCSAVGSYSLSLDDSEGLLLDERDGVWQRGVEAKVPADAGNPAFVEMNSVSCPSTAMCSALGTYDNGSSDTEPLLLTQSAGKWQSAPPEALPSDAATHPVTFMFSVSCASAGSCAAAGTYVNDSGSGGNQSGLLYDGVATQPTTTVHAPKSGKAGSAIAAGSVTTTLSHGDAPVGSLTVSVFGPRPKPPAHCTTGAAITRTVKVSGNASYHPATGFTPPRSGNYWWYSSYAGDGSDAAAASPCGAGMAKTVVKRPARPHLTGKPKISGTARKGHRLKVAHGHWSSAEKLSYGYRWERCSTAGKHCKAIHAATAAKYRLSAADVGHRITVVVTAADADRQRSHATAKPVGPVKR